MVLSIFSLVTRPVRTRLGISLASFSGFCGGDASCSARIVFTRAISRRTAFTRADAFILAGRALEAQIELLPAQIRAAIGIPSWSVDSWRGISAGLVMSLALTQIRVTNLVLIGNFAAPSASAVSSQISGDTPSISNMMRPGFTRATQNSGAALAGAHADFSRLGGDRDIRKDADPHTPGALHGARDGAAGRFDLARGNPLRLQRLQAELAEIQRRAALGQAMDTAFMGLAEFRSV